MVENIEYLEAKNGLSRLACYHAKSGADIIKFIEENKIFIKQEVEKCGGILLRNFSLRAVSDFSRVVNSLSCQLSEYLNRSTPRTRLGGKIFTSTEYPAHKNILLHNENSYTLSWPKRIIFFCAIAPQAAGETPVADARYVLKKIDSSILEKFIEKKILYRRNYSVGLDLSWQECFQTTDKAEVELYCEQHNIQYKWHSANSNNLELSTEQVCQAILQHHTTGEKVWFNQAHLFHTAALEETDKAFLLSMCDKDTLPRQSYYGDGSEIANEEIYRIIEAYKDEKVIFSWQKGDVMILDNVLMAHGRHSFKGERKVAVAMTDD